MRRRPTDAAALPDAREAAVAFLARRDLASAELRSRLQSRGYPPEGIESALTALTEEGLLNDARYAHAQVLARTAHGQGPLRIREHLLQAGVPEPLIEAALTAGPDWTALAGEVRQRRFGITRPTSPQEQVKQARFLLSRGFTLDQIRSATGIDIDPAW